MLPVLPYLRDCVLRLGQVVLVGFVLALRQLLLGRASKPGLTRQLMQCGRHAGKS